MYIFNDFFYSLSCNSVKWITECPCDHAKMQFWQIGHTNSVKTETAILWNKKCPSVLDHLNKRNFRAFHKKISHMQILLFSLFQFDFIYLGVFLYPQSVLVVYGQGHFIHIIISTEFENYIVLPSILAPHVWTI